MAGQARPMRSVKNNSDLILFGEREAQVNAEFTDVSALQVSVHIDCDGKKVKINQKPTRDALMLREKIALVTFVPEDLSAVTGTSSLRRKLLDQITASLYPNYALYYRQYEKALLGRNRLLKLPIVDLVELGSFTEVLAQIGLVIEQTRQQALEQLRPYYTQNVLSLSGDLLTSNLTYQPTSRGDLKTSLSSLKSEERARKTTLLGPHLDDLEISLNEHPARFTASRGQARLLILALKIAQLQTVHEHRQIKPVLLLDDVVGELDPDNSRRLLEVIDQIGTQTFITTTHLDAIPGIWPRQPGAQLVRVESGQCCFE